MNLKTITTPKILYALLLALVGLVPQSQAQVMPLDSVLATIRRQNPMLGRYDYQVRAKDAYVQGAGSWMAPQVGAGLWMAPYDKRMAGEMSNGQDLGSVMLTVEQMIPNPAKQRAQRAYLRAQSSVERSNQQVQFNGLRAQAKGLYYDWVVLEKRQAVLKENEEIIRFMIKLAEVRYPYNQSKLNSIYDAQAKLGQLANEQLMVKSQIRQRQIGLNTLMNLPGNNAFRVDTTLDLNRQVIAPLDTATLASDRSDIRSLEQTIRVMQLGQRQEKSMLKPDFGIRYEHMSSIGSMPNQYTVMGMMTIPFAPWASKMTKSNVKAMNYEIEAMRRERQAVLNEATGMIASMQSEIETKGQQIKNYRERILPALRKNYQVTLQAYEQNTAELPLVLNAWETLNMTQMQYLDTLNELLQMQVTYERELEK
jgi:outer membrane protein TolC